MNERFYLLKIQQLDIEPANYTGTGCHLNKFPIGN